ncbi:MAG TPA: cation diffusion facilitator family transporter [Thermoanaerobaculales bacterium]|mgnify:CR=1 FL=1|nr:cation diffusion facilitator family transporter [Thermoanaerobaculales bacterium]
MQNPQLVTPGRGALARWAWLSIAAAGTTIFLKVSAYLLTGSVGLLSDAAESGVNLAGAVMALAMLTIAARPADEDHAHGHSKAEYFASGVEGLLILLAAAAIAGMAVERLFSPRPLEQVGPGLAVSVAASLINLAVGLALIRVGKRCDSITLEADGQHLLTDVWTSAGVIAGVGIVAITGWHALDPIVALLVAANIVWTGIRLMRRSVAGLMDASLPEPEQRAVEAVLERYRQQGVEFHALRTRQAAARRFVSVHVLVPGESSVHDAHHVAEDLERDIRAVLGNAVVTTHLEPVEDEISLNDIHIH